MPNVINNFRLDIPTLVSKMPPVHVKSSEVSLVAAGVVGTLTVVQLLTDWDPLGRCFTFWRQLRHHVSCCCCAARLFEMFFFVSYGLGTTLFIHYHFSFPIGKETFMLGNSP
jgi:hypothetical protein